MSGKSEFRASVLVLGLNHGERAGPQACPSTRPSLQLHLAAALQTQPTHLVLSNSNTTLKCIFNENKNLLRKLLKTLFRKNKVILCGGCHLTKIWRHPMMWACEAIINSPSVHTPISNMRCSVLSQYQSSSHGAVNISTGYIHTSQSQSIRRYINSNSIDSPLPLSDTLTHNSDKIDTEVFITYLINLSHTCCWMEYGLFGILYVPCEWVNESKVWCLHEIFALVWLMLESTMEHGAPPNTNSFPSQATTHVIISPCLVTREMHHSYQLSHLPSDGSDTSTAKKYFEFWVNDGT